MSGKLKELLFPSNSNAKNRNSIFLWSLVCLIVVMAITYYNGYYHGKSATTKSISKAVRDSADVSDSKIRIDKLVADSSKRQGELDEFSKLVNDDLYVEFQNAKTRTDLENLMNKLTRLKVNQPALQNSKIMISHSIETKLNIIAGKDSTIESLNDEIKEKIKKNKTLDEISAKDGK